MATKVVSKKSTDAIRHVSAQPKGKLNTVYQLKIKLEGSKPPIWRRLEVASTVKLDHLASIILDTMGWDNSHLHQYIVGKDFYSLPDPTGMMETLNESKYTLAKILPEEKSKCLFEYDFGDSWRHEILVEKIIETEPGVTYPRCTAGEMACPPEDCGGVWGYYDILEALENPKHPEHASYREWLGLGRSKKYDPTKFSVKEVNKRL